MDNMRCRALVQNVDSAGKKHVDVVWFGSTGTIQLGFDVAIWDATKWDTEDAVAKFFDESKSSYVDKQRAVADSLTQRLFVIKRELWYAMNYGLPLFEKNRSKTEFDAFILSTISQHPDVISIERFSSALVNKAYTCSVIILSKYGEISLNM